MEKAILCRDPYKHNIKDFERVYIGNEFCQNLLFSLNSLKNRIDRVLKHNKNFSIVTPYVTDWGLQILKKYFDFLNKHHPGTEIIVNDFGVMDLACDYQNLEPVLGRAIGNHLTKGPPDLKPNSGQALSFFFAKGIKRCEVSNKGDYAQLDTHKELEYSLYYPYMFVSTGRRCMVGFENKKAEEGFDPKQCKRPCNQNYYLITHKQIQDKIIVYGNTHFIKKNKLPSLTGISRLVYMPDSFFN